VSSDQIVAKIVEILDKSDDGATAVLPVTMQQAPNESNPSRMSFANMLSQKTVMRAIEFFEGIKQTKGPEP
jgi:hypothetical protein